MNRPDDSTELDHRIVDRYRDLNEEDEAILDNLKAVVKGIAMIFGKHCEVVLHSLKDLEHSVIAIENGSVTGRKLGSPMTDLGLSVLEKFDEAGSDTIGNYYSKTKNGDHLKSITIVIRNLKRKPIGFLCININLSAPIDSFMKELLESKGSFLRKGVIEHYPLTANELLERTYTEVLRIVNTYKKLNPNERLKRIVKELYIRGIFNIKNGVDYVAEYSGVSRYTVYNYIRDIKTELELSH